MIRRIELRRWKRFPELRIDLPGHVVLAGPNNAGKTTILQALAAWDFALRRWRELNSSARPHGMYPFATVARPDFLAVPLPSGGLDLLWHERQTAERAEIGVVDDRGRRVAMEFEFDDEQMRLRPTQHTKAADLAELTLPTVYVPPMSGLTPQEPHYADDLFLAARLAEGRPGEVLRNLLLRTSRREPVWNELVATVERLFGYTLQPPRTGKYLTAEYRASSSGRPGPAFDLGSAGSGFQQVLMLLTFLAAQPNTVLLVDEPDAHLHIILQDAIFHELHAVAARHGSQLILATHSEVIINSVRPQELLLMPQGKPLADKAEQRTAVRGLGILSNADLMMAGLAPGILYVEGATDVDLLRAFAKVLRHPAEQILTKNLFWHRYSDQARDGGEGFASRDHFAALQLFQPNLRGLEILDKDGNPNLPETEVNGQGLQRLRWRRYEIESYLLHPAALERFVMQQTAASAVDVAPLRAKMAELLTDAFVAAPLVPNRPAEAVLQQDKARTLLLPPILDAGGLIAFPYTRYHEIAATMLPDEVHPEVGEKLDALCRAFGLGGGGAS